MKTIQVKDKSFTVFVPESRILERVDRVAAQITRDLQDKDPIFICVLNGSFMFTSDLMKRLNFPCEVTFVKMASYLGTESTGDVRHLIGLNVDIRDRVVVIIEDIIDTGYTMQEMLKTLNGKGAKEIKICTLLVKPTKLKVDLNIDYCAMEIPNGFIVGYGLDYDGYGRNLPEIYTLVEK